MQPGLFLNIIIAFAALTTTSSSIHAQLRIINTLDLNRDDELIVLRRSAIENKIGKLTVGKYVTINTQGNRPVVLQYDDLDQDGNWDEISFLQSFAPRQEIQFSLVIADAPATVKAVVRAHARHKRKDNNDRFGNDLKRDSVPAGQQPTDFAKQPLPPFLTEGPAWENDKVGFRLYFDVRNGKDIWGKTTSRMVLDEVGAEASDDYHKQAEWGMDILKVGQSLGAGSLAMLVNLKSGSDTLVRLGGKNMGPIIYEKVADGPVRAIIRLRYPEWKIMDGLTPVSLIEEISIWGGKYFYESKVHVTNAPQDAKLVTGIVNLHSKRDYRLDSADCKILYTYDEQSENQDKLGMGVIMRKEQFHAFGVTPNEGTDIWNTYTVSSSVDSDKPLIFRFYAGWEKSNELFSSETGFRQLLCKEAVLMKNPLVIK